MEPARRDNTLSGRVIDGRYRIVGELGEGGMGTVYRAEHLKLGRKVAIKVLLTEYGDNHTLRARFEREAKALAALSHPNIVTVTDYGLADELPFLVMELLEGRTLKDRIAAGPLAPDEALRITREMLRGLGYAHGQGVAHRDLKPGNVFLQALPDGLEHVKLLDFGLAKFVAFEERADGPPLTRLGSVLGTPAYMAPEQASGDTSDTRSDVYAAGILLFEMLSGDRPFDGEPGDVLRQQLLSPLPPISSRCPGREASPELESFLARATAKERAARFQNASEMLAALDAVPHPIVRTTASAARGSSPDAPTRADSRPILVSGTAATMPGSVQAAQLRASSAHAQPRTRGSGGAVAAVLGAVALIVVALGALVFGVVIWSSVSGGGDEVEGGLEPPPPVTATGEPDDVPAVAPSPAPEAPGTRPSPETQRGPEAPAQTAPSPPGSHAPGTFATDPWAAPTPRLLADIKRALDAGRRVSSRVDGRLIAYARDHRDDPRPQILLGRAYLARGWRPDAMERFETAYQTNTSAAGDPQMLDAVVRLAAHSRTSSRASALLLEAWGARALPAVDAALSSGELESDEAERLARIRGTLR